jgi:hypothetical protein
VVAGFAILRALRVVFLTALDAVLAHLGTVPAGFGASVRDFARGLSRTANKGQSGDAGERAHQGTTIRIHITNSKRRIERLIRSGSQKRRKTWIASNQNSQRQSLD